MGTSKTTEDEREEFLATPRVGIISINRLDGKAPLATPVWYNYVPGGDVTVLTEPSSLKCRLILASGGFTLTVQNDRYPYGYVSVSGDATIDTSPRPEEILALANRYPESEATAFGDASAANGDVLARMRPTKWFAQDYTKS